ncbi:hypothetical protein BBK36DRAFT_1197640, partial [Trichoderma citrinoviride]
KGPTPKRPAPAAGQGPGHHQSRCLALVEAAGPLSAGRIIGMPLTVVVGFSKKGPARVIVSRSRPEQKRQRNRPDRRLWLLGKKLFQRLEHVMVAIRTSSFHV